MGRLRFFYGFLLCVERLPIDPGAVWAHQVQVNRHDRLRLWIVLRVFAWIRQGAA